MLYGSNGAASSNTPKFTVLSNVFPANNTVNNVTLFTNTTPSAAVKNMVVGLYGVTPGQAAVAHNTYGKKCITPGWVLRRSGMGPLVSINITNAGTGYSNLDVVHVNGVAGCVNTSATVLTNGSGVVTGLTNFANNGGLFPNTAYAVVTISNTTGGTANGSSFAATAVLGGRAGRIHNEVLVVQGSMTSNTTYNPAAFPSS